MKNSEKIVVNFGKKKSGSENQPISPTPCQHQTNAICQNSVGSFFLSISNLFFYQHHQHENQVLFSERWKNFRRENHDYSVGCVGKRIKY